MDWKLIMICHCQWGSYIRYSFLAKNIWNHLLWNIIEACWILFYWLKIINFKGPRHNHFGFCILFIIFDDFTPKLTTMYWIFPTPLSRQNTSASGARPNPQGSFRYGSINVTDTYVVKVTSPELVNGTIRATINGISFLKPDVPFRLADQHQLKGIYKLDFPSKPMNRTPIFDRSLINATYKGFIEIILQNNDTSIQNFHLDGYSFFVVG